MVQMLCYITLGILRESHIVPVTLQINKLVGRVRCKQVVMIYTDLYEKFFGDSREKGDKYLLSINYEGPTEESLGCYSNVCIHKLKLTLDFAFSMVGFSGCLTFL